MKLILTSLTLLIVMSSNTFGNTTEITKTMINKEESITPENIFSSNSEILYKDKWWKKALKIIGKDLAGGLAGAVSASAVPGLGTGIGAIIGGAGASLSEAGSISNPNNNSNGQIGNINNKYDLVGYKHVEILALSLKEENARRLKRKNRLNELAFLNFAKKHLSDDETYSEKELEKYTISMLREDLNLASELSLEALVRKLEESEKISSKDGGVLELYFSEMNNINSLNTLKSFINFSIKIENSISDSNFPESSKELLLSTMSTARYDLAFWISNGYLLE